MQRVSQTLLHRRIPLLLVCLVALLVAAYAGIARFTNPHRASQQEQRILVDPNTINNHDGARY